VGLFQPRQLPHGQTRVGERLLLLGCPTLSRNIISKILRNSNSTSHLLHLRTSTFHHLSTWRVQMQKMTTEAAQKPLLQLMSNQQQGTDSPTAAGSEGSTQHKNFGGSGSNSASSSSFSSSTTPSPDNSFHSSPSVSCPGTPSRHSRRMAKKKRHRPPGDPSNPLRQSSERSLTSSSSSLPTFSPPSLSSLPSLSAVGHSSSSVVPDYGGLPPQEKKRVVVHIDMVSCNPFLSCLATNHSGHCRTVFMQAWQYETTHRSKGCPWSSVSF